MHRGVTRRLTKSFITAVLVGGSLLYGAQNQAAVAQSSESLGDVARANRVNQQAQQTSGTTPKVITNQDLPAGSTEVPQSVDSNAMTTVSGVQKSNRNADQRLSNRLQSEQRVGTEWKARIQAQEERVADLQARVDHVNASLRSGAQYDAGTNRYQNIQEGRLAMMQDMLDQQKRRLAVMQDEARHAGMDQ
jgi:hypothetical protein